MTPAEKLARYLDDEGETVHAEIVRRLAAALVDAEQNLGRAGVWEDDFRATHADALRDVKEMP